MESSPRIDELTRKYDENPRRYFAALANEYRKIGEYERAISLCRAHLPSQPGHMSGQVVFGQSLFDAGRLAESKVVFERALQLDPENLIALGHLGDIARQGGDTEMARRWYGRLLAVDPLNENAGRFMRGAGAAAAPAVETVLPQAAAAAPKAVEHPIAPPAEPVAPAAQTPAPEPEAAPAAASVASEAPALAAASIPAAAEAPAPPPESAATVPVETAGAASPEPVADSAAFEVPDAPAGFESLAGATEIQSDDQFQVPDEAGPLAGLQTFGTDVDAGTESLGDWLTTPLSDAETTETFEDQGYEVVEGTAEDLEDAGIVAAEEQVEAQAPNSETTAASFGEAAVAAAAASNTPFVTETLADLYLRQGHKQQALDLYRKLQADRPGESWIVDRVQELEQALQAEQGEEGGGADEAHMLQEFAGVPRPTHEDDTIVTGPSLWTPDMAAELEFQARAGMLGEEARPEETDAEPGSVDRSRVPSARWSYYAPGSFKPSVRDFFASLGRRRAPADFKPAEPADALASLYRNAEPSSEDGRAAVSLASAFSSEKDDIEKFNAWLRGLNES